MAPQQHFQEQDTSCTRRGHSFTGLFSLPQPSFQAQPEDHSQYGSNSLLEEEEAEIERDIRWFGSKYIVLHMAGDVTSAKGTCFANAFFSPWEILAFHSCKGIQLFSRCRPQESLVLVVGWSLMEGEKKQLLGFLQLLLFFLLQSERGGVETPHLSSTSTAGGASQCRDAAEVGGCGKNALNENTRRQIKGSYFL